ncbi:peptidoglycan-binding domain-containing protein [Actinoplanes sp. NPDC026619]|uniref:peptidoglycan-binding domain-containing protein n=1 Tax=Actinoplanes sp. NPDC026619 TaxID=3155798 RepID=UPI0034085E0A
MRRRALILFPALAVGSAAVAAGTGLLGGGGASPAGAARTGPPATATVGRRTMTRSQTVDGTLGYGDSAPVAAGAPGMVTWLPAEADVIARGDTVYRVDQKRIPLLYGSIPLYRTLSAGRAGDDVRQLERNLAALGYRGFTADGKYTAATAGAVREWQRDLGRDRTGVVQPGDAVVSSGARRVATLTATPGTAASGVLMQWTGTTPIVGVDLDTDYADLVKVGAVATVRLPDETTVPARVTRIGTPAAKEKGGGATLPVRLAVTDPAKLGSYRVSRVDVDLTAETRTNVLAVPVDALVARPGGGYAVVVGGDYVPVTTGLFAGGYVEVTGVAEGASVGVPQ